MHNTDVLEFQDSEISSAEIKDNQFVVRFSAARIHRISSQDDGSDLFQALELTIDQPIIIERDSGCVGRLSQGSLRVAGTTVKHVPIPYEAKADVELEIVFANGSTCKVMGKRIETKQTGETRVMEWLKC